MNFMQAVYLHCSKAVLTLRNVCGFSAFVYFLVQDFLDSAKAALSLISYHTML